jgi:transposase
MVSGKNLSIRISEEDRRSLKSWQHSEVVSSAMANRARVILLLADGLSVSAICRAVDLSRNNVYKWIRRYQLYGVKGLAGLRRAPQRKDKRQKTPKRSANKRQNNFDIKLSDKEQWLLRAWQRSETTDAALARRGRVILHLASGKNVSETSRAVGMSRQQIYTLANRFKLHRVKGLHKSPREGIKKAEQEDIKSAVFSILNRPPSEYNINRTSWRLVDLKMCLANEGIHVSRSLISQIIKSAGYSWRRARVVLTSNDPDYRRKLGEIQTILSSLGDNDFFFSIDEFGPIAIKMRGGKRLVAPNEYPTIPQFQKSKGRLIMTAALELKSNQITHFYSKKKNTTEMIKLLEVLLSKYSSAERLYLSWDNARWHVARKLKRRVEEINSLEYRAEHSCPYVELAPLPSGAQFLNVIESVFSGMARAIIHNSNYESVDECRRAIDRYIKERNQYFLENPKRAGKKIWGEERVKAVFSEINNCKDPKWR